MQRLFSFVPTPAQLFSFGSVNVDNNAWKQNSGEKWGLGTFVTRMASGGCELDVGSWAHSWLSRSWISNFKHWASGGGAWQLDRELVQDLMNSWWPVPNLSSPCIHPMPLKGDEWSQTFPAFRHSSASMYYSQCQTEDQKVGQVLQWKLSIVDDFGRQTLAVLLLTCRLQLSN